jgi:hypothetical protein
MILGMAIETFTFVHVLLNVFVGVAQAFLKVPALRAMAPKQTEPPFVVAQSVVLASFLVLGIVAAIRFRREPLQTARPGMAGN